LKCKNPLKYFICNNFAFLVFLIMCQKDIYLNSRVSFESTLHLNYVKNLQNWNIIFIYKWGPFNMFGNFSEIFQKFSIGPPFEIFSPVFLQPRPGIPGLQSTKNMRENKMP
jgi:hypothetical protein